MLSDEWANVEQQEQSLRPGHVSAGFTFYKERERKRSASGTHFKLELKQQEKAGQHLSSLFNPRVHVGKKLLLGKKTSRLMRSNMKSH